MMLNGKENLDMDNEASYVVKECSFKMKLIPTKTGDVVFNDNLVHGGV